MAVLQKVKINGEWVPVSNSNVNSGGGVSEDGTLLLPIYAAELQGNIPLTSEEIEANKIAYGAAREGVKALYYAHSVQLGDIKNLMIGTIVGTDAVIFQSSLGVTTSSDPNSDICDVTMYAVMISSDGQSQVIDLSRNLATKEYVDAHIEGGAGGGLETRILYVPELTADAELTDDQKAYNVETCQKLMNGTARAFLTDGQVYAYTENIIDISELMGSGYAVYFDQPSIYAIGGFAIEDGDIVLSFEPISPAVVVSKDTPAGSIFSSILMPMLTGKALPTFYIAYEGRNYLATDCIFVAGGLGLTYESEFLQLTFAYTGQVSFFAIQFPSFLTIGNPSAVDDNVKWIKNKSVSYLQLPRIRDYFNANMSYIPVYINRYSAQTTYADFGIMRNGALEVWRIHEDGTSELVTE